MLRLIQNEYIKIFKKISSIVLCVLFVIATILLPIGQFAISKLSNSFHTPDFMIESDMTYYEENGQVSYADYLAYCKDNKINPYEFTWKNAALENAFSMNIKLDQKHMDELTDLEAVPMYEYGEYDEGDYFYDMYDSVHEGFVDISPGLFLSDSERKEIKNQIISYVEDDDATGYIKYYNEKITPILKEYPKKISPKYQQELFVSEKELLSLSNAYKLILDNNIDLNEEAWAYQVAKNYSDYINNDNTENPEAEILKYRLENHVSEVIEENIFSNSYTSNNSFVANMLSSKFLITLVSLIIFIMAIGIISKEYNRGTIKFLLINPVKRSSIFWSKVITLASLATFATIWVYISQFILNMIFCGLPKNVCLLQNVDGNIVSTNAQTIIICTFLNSLLSVLVLITIGIMMSALLRNSAVSAGIVLVVYLVGSVLSPLTLRYGYDLFKFYLFNNTDIYGIICKKPKFMGQTPLFASIVVLVYVVIFLWTARDAFVKKDI